MPELENPLILAILDEDGVAESVSTERARADRERRDRGRSSWRRSVVDSLAAVPAAQSVLSGNTLIGGLCGRYRHRERERTSWRLKVGCSRYNGLLEIWGIEYLRKSPDDLRRHKAVYKEVPLNAVRWLHQQRPTESKQKDTASAQTEPVAASRHRAVAERERADHGQHGDTLRLVLRKQLHLILAKHPQHGAVDKALCAKILQSAHSKVLKAYRQLNESKKAADRGHGDDSKQSLGHFVKSMDRKIADLVRKYVNQYRKRGLFAAAQNAEDALHDAAGSGHGQQTLPRSHSEPAEK